MTQANLLPHIELNPQSPATATVIWLHGLGATGDDFVPIVPELNLPSELAVRFIFPHAPAIPVTINAGYVMPAWYDITAMTLDRQLDEAQLLASSAAISAFIDNEIARGINSQRIIVAGFSQGGAVSVVNETLGSQALQLLRQQGYAPVYKSYLMDHAVCAEEINDISMWIQERLK